MQVHRTSGGIKPRPPQPLVSMCSPIYVHPAQLSSAPRHPPTHLCLCSRPWPLLPAPRWHLAPRPPSPCTASGGTAACPAASNPHATGIGPGGTCRAVMQIHPSVLTPPNTSCQLPPNGTQKEPPPAASGNGPAPAGCAARPIHHTHAHSQQRRAHYKQPVPHQYLECSCYAQCKPLPVRSHHHDRCHSSHCLHHCTHSFRAAALAAAAKHPSALPAT
jgi:hypothetical protein